MGAPHAGGGSVVALPAHRDRGGGPRVKTILLADDSITIQKVVELTFSDGDYRVLCVSNGAQALRKITEARPDIALLDVIMPEKNGYEVCEAMKADPATAGIPVLLLTGTFEPFDRQRAEAAGAEGHLTKPFESHALVARVEELIASGATRSAAPVPAVAAAPAVPARGVEAAPAGRALRAGPAVGSAAEGQPPVPAAPFAPPLESAPSDGPHPAFAAPDAAAGGSYMGFADISIEDEVVPDRYDVGSPATVRISREEAPPVSEPDNDTPAMEGFVPGYDLPPQPVPAPRATAAEPAQGPQPMPPVAARPPAPLATAATDSASVGSLSDAALERLAEMIVRRMSERVVREIAWEVIPGVAEAIVRQRIREIEGQER
jgi:CheY-like chemotaxis protein